jgi:hypothetical protein
MLSAGGGAAAVLTLGVGAGPADAVPRSRADVVLAWNRVLLKVVRTAGAVPATVHATRAFAIMHAAIQDAVVATTGAGRPYLFRVEAEPGASPVAAAAQAAHDVLAALFPKQAADFDQQLTLDLATVPDVRALRAGVRAGALTAKLLLALRADDGSGATPPALPPGTEPGQYRPTPPGFAAAVFTHWSAVTPFVVDRADQFRPGAFPALSSARYAAAINEVQRLGRDTSTERTADQTEQARFWAAPIWNYWNEITQTVVQARHTSLSTAARVFARLNLTFADAVISFYEAKYHYRIWRPITAIRLADTDGNPATTPDVSWNSLANTPADPSYPGAHSVISTAGAAVLRDEFGPVQRVSVSSEVLPGVQRSFTRFTDIADDAGQSRIPAGVHTNLDHESGQQLGFGVAKFVLAHT